MRPALLLDEAVLLQAVERLCGVGGGGGAGDVLSRPASFEEWAAEGVAGDGEDLRIGGQDR
jgi:hypothetical protein